MPNLPGSYPDWFNRNIFFGVDVKGWEPGQPLLVDSTALGYPAPLVSLAEGDCITSRLSWISAVGLSITTSPGTRLV